MTMIGCVCLLYRMLGGLAGFPRTNDLLDGEPLPWSRDAYSRRLATGARDASAHSQTSKYGTREDGLLRSRVRDTPHVRKQLQK